MDEFSAKAKEVFWRNIIGLPHSEQWEKGIAHAFREVHNAALEKAVRKVENLASEFEPTQSITGRHVDDTCRILKSQIRALKVKEAGT